MSPRAAARLESLGFEDVYDYIAGKADWLANGLPVEGEEADTVRAGDLARSDVPTCRLDIPIAAARERMETSGWEICVVVDADAIVHGLLHLDEIPAADHDTAVEAYMEAGPKTFRPDSAPKSMHAYLDRNDREAVLVTTNRGELLGAVSKNSLLKLQE